MPPLSCILDTVQVLGHSQILALGHILVSSQLTCYRQVLAVQRTLTLVKALSLGATASFRTLTLPSKLLSPSL